VYFSFSVILSSRHIPGPTVCIYHFSCFSIFLVIFHYLKSVILIFRQFQFSRHIPGCTVCISHFSLFSVISSFFQVVKYMFLIFHDYQYSCHISCPTVDISKFSTFFSFPRHIARPKVCISHFPWFSGLAIFLVLQCAFVIFHVFQYFSSYFTT